MMNRRTRADYADYLTYPTWYAGGLLVLLFLLVSATLLAAAPAKKPLDFDRDVRPILSENCFACHGFDANQRQAGLRLDTAAGATQMLASGARAVVPGKPASSTLLARVLTHDGGQMPPASTGKTLTKAQIAVLRRWISEGGKYTQHWAYLRPKRVALPAVANKAWAGNPIDRFVLARLQKEGLQPSPPADRATLLRRVSFDLTGLPPTPAQLDAFISDKRPGAYERVVDTLLASPRFGERMALAWLDLARYADTHGYHIDSQRDMWPWRDWVIRAFNRNLPYDQFVVEQIAGDLLPGATLDQKIATGFNRNHPINFEGGAIPEEYAAQYVFDRADTTSTVFLAQTMACAKCHDHKYDPLTQRDYYRFFAFFNNVPEKGLDGKAGNAEPFLQTPLPGQQEALDKTDAHIAATEKAMAASRAAQRAEAQTAWELRAAATLAADPALAGALAAHYGLDEAAASAGGPSLVPGQLGGARSFDGQSHVDLGGAAALAFERTEAFSYGAWVKPAANEPAAVLSQLNDAADFRGWDLYLNNGKVFVHLISQWETNAVRVNTKSVVVKPNEWAHLLATYDGSSKAKGIAIYVNGKPAELQTTHDTLTGTIKTDGPARLGGRSASAFFKGLIDEVRVYKGALPAANAARLFQIETVRPILILAASKRTAEQISALQAFYLETNDPPYQKLAAELAALRKTRDEQDKAIPTSMVMADMPTPRPTFVLTRGQYDQKGEKVSPGTPSVLPPLAPGARPDRLALARWLVRPDHPLSARVAVNRTWQMLWGQGLVATAENFGTQGEYPSHPDLLDWLATEFVRTGWDQKALLRLLVTSQTYRQSSRTMPPLLKRDPENRLLARGARFRLPGEMVRDQALALGGLLVPTIGGPSVKPYQAPGLWEEIAFGGGYSAQKYVQDTGDALYRRSMYTFWKRTVPPPGLQTFDAPEREFCLVRRSVTNTPLQALVLMNDVGFVEASRKFAERVVREGGQASPARLHWAFRTAVGRSPRPDETTVLRNVYTQQRQAFAHNPDAALKLLGVGESKRDADLDPVDLAAWATVASVLFNLDETITKN